MRAGQQAFVEGQRDHPLFPVIGNNKLVPALRQGQIFHNMRTGIQIPGHNVFAIQSQGDRSGLLHIEFHRIGNVRPLAVIGKQPVHRKSLHLNPGQSAGNRISQRARLEPEFPLHIVAHNSRRDKRKRIWYPAVRTKRTFKHPAVNIHKGIKRKRNSRFNLVRFVFVQSFPSGAGICSNIYSAGDQLAVHRRILRCLPGALPMSFRNADCFGNMQLQRQCVHVEYCLEPQNL